MRLDRQGLLAAEKGGPSGARAVIDSLGQIQVDPMNVVSRSVHLVFWSRAPKYRPSDLAALYSNGPRVFEYWTRVASLLSMDLYPLIAPTMQTRRADTWWGKWVRGWLTAHADLAAHILREIEEKGPMSSRDFPGERRVRSGWGSAKETKHGLDALWATGKLMVAERRRGEKVFDLTSRVLPQGAELPRLPERERIRRLLRVGLASSGACTVHELAALFGAAAWPRDRKLKGRDICENAVQDGFRLFQVAGSRDQWVCLAEDFDQLRRPRRSRRRPRMTFLCPFDNLLWSRGSVAELYGFDYKLEAYTPPAKREFGYYVMPILWGESLIGRVDPKLDRDRMILQINGIWLEQSTRVSQPLVAELAGTLTAFAGFLGATDVAIARSSPASLKQALEKRLS